MCVGYSPRPLPVDIIDGRQGQRAGMGAADAARARAAAGGAPAAPGRAPLAAAAPRLGAQAPGKSAQTLRQGPQALALRPSLQRLSERLGETGALSRGQFNSIASTSTALF